MSIILKNIFLLFLLAFMKKNGSLSSQPRKQLQLYTHNADLQKLRKYYASNQILQWCSWAERFLQEQIGEIIRHLESVPWFTTERIEEIVMLISYGYNQYFGEIRKKEQLSSGEPLASFSHQLWSCLEILRDLAVMGTLQSSDFTITEDQRNNQELYNQRKNDYEFIKTPKNLYEIIVTTLFHDDIEKKKIYDIDDVAVWAIFDTLLKNASLETRVFFTKSALSTINQAHIDSWFSIFALIFKITNKPEIAFRIMENVILLTYPEDEYWHHTLEPDVYFKRLKWFIPHLVKAYEQINNSRSTHTIPVKKFTNWWNDDSKRNTRSKFTLWVTTRTKEFPWWAVVWKKSQELYKPTHPIEKQIFSTVDFWVNHDAVSRGISYTENIAYTLKLKKIAGWEQIVLNSAERLAEIMQSWTVLNDTFTEYSYPQTINEIKQWTFLKPKIKPWLTAYDLHMFFDDKHHHYEKNIELHNNILLAALDKKQQWLINPLYINHQNWKMQLTAEWEKQLAKWFMWWLEFGSQELGVEIPQSFYQELKQLWCSVVHWSDWWMVTSISYAAFHKIVHYSAHTKNKDSLRWLLHDAYLRSYLHTLLDTNTVLSEQDFEFMHYVHDHFLTIFQWTTKMDMQKIATMRDIYRQACVCHTDIQTLSNSEEKEITQLLLKRLTEEFFTLFDQLIVYVFPQNEKIMQWIQNKPYWNTLRQKTISLYSRVKNWVSIKKSMMRKKEDDPSKAITDWFWITISQPDLLSILVIYNFWFDYGGMNHAMPIIHKQKNQLITQEDIEKFKYSLTPDFYTILQVSLDKKEKKKTTTDNAYQDAKMQATPKGTISLLEMKFVLDSAKNEKWFAHHDFYGYIGKVLELFLRRRTILTEQDFETIILLWFEKSLHIQNQFNYDAKLALKASKKHYQKKWFVPVYHGTNNNVVYWRTTVHAWNEYLLTLENHELPQYQIKDPFFEAPTSTHTIDWLLDNHIKTFFILIKNYSLITHHEISMLTEQINSGRRIWESYTQKKQLERKLQERYTTTIDMIERLVREKE